MVHLLVRRVYPFPALLTAAPGVASPYGRLSPSLVPSLRFTQYGESVSDGDEGGEKEEEL